jgi:hypothetical protein
LIFYLINEDINLFVKGLWSLELFQEIFNLWRYFKRIVIEELFQGWIQKLFGVKTCWFAEFLCVYPSLWIILQLIKCCKHLVIISILLSYLIWLNELLDTFGKLLFSLLINLLFFVIWDIMELFLNVLQWHFISFCC